MTRRLLLALLLGLAGLVVAAPAVACDGGATAHGNNLYAGVTCVQPKPKPRPVGPVDTHPIVHTTDPTTPTVPANCVNGVSESNGQTCYDNAPGVPAPAVPVVGDADAQHAFEQIPLPQLASQTQPTAKTLVNFDTIFYVDAQQFQRTVVLLGQQVTLDITPNRFLWTYGDGTQQTTDTPGARYPAKQVVHRYPKAHRDVAHAVAITWKARYRVGDGPWRPVPGTVTSQGPPTTLHVSEATPVLTGRQ